MSFAQNRNLVRIVLVGVGLISVAVVVRILAVPNRRPPIVAKAAGSASPEVAELLFEVDDVVREMEERYPGSVNAMNATAMLHARFGDQDEAIAYWERCLDIAPNFAEAHFEIGLIVHEAGDNARASDRFRRATEIDSSSSNHAVHWAKSLLNEGKLHEAAEVLRDDLARRPSSVPSRAILGDTYLQLNQYAEARKCYEQVIGMAPNMASAYYGLGMTCSKMGEPEKAKPYLARFRELKAQDEQAHRDELKTEGLGLVRVRESVAEILVAVAKGYLAQDDPKTAEGILLRARELSPKLNEAWRVLIWLYERQVRMDEAVKAAEGYAESNPESVMAQLGLAQLLTRVGRLDEAEQAFLLAVNTASNQAETHARLAEFYLSTKRKPDEATAAAERAVELAPTGYHFFLLAMAHSSQGEMDVAKRAIEQAIQRDPDRRDYRELYEKISGEMSDARREE